MALDLTQRLAPNFLLKELVASTKAAELGIDNTPPDYLLPRFIETAEMLQRVRDFLRSVLSADVRINVTSGYRCAQLNGAVGSATSSDHITGEAADFVASGATPYQTAVLLAPMVSVLGIGQLIYEGTSNKAGRVTEWVHCSTRVPDKLVNRILTIHTGVLLAGIHQRVTA